MGHIGIGAGIFSGAFNFSLRNIDLLRPCSDKVAYRGHLDTQPAESKGFQAHRLLPQKVSGNHGVKGKVSDLHSLSCQYLSIKLAVLGYFCQFIIFENRL